MRLLGNEAEPLAQRTSEGVARVLREAILFGRFKAGEPLRERTLGAELGLSRTPIREALFILQGEGLVDLIPNRGATVRSITPDDIAQIYSLRAVLEAHAARIAAQTRTDQDLADMEEAHARLKRIGARGTAAEQAQGDLAFHSAISASTGSRMLTTITREVLAFTVAYRSRYTYPKTHFKIANEQHRSILDAVRDRDADRAEALTQSHITWSTELALAHFNDHRADDTDH
jgi:DNA-binding GntR family transcriptional regulator